MSNQPTRRQRWRNHLGRIERRLGYRFNDRNLLRTALTHRSASKRGNYETLELIGDRALHFTIPYLLLDNNPEIHISELNQRYQEMTTNKNLAFMALRLHLAQHIKHKTGESQSIQSKILADAVEATIGAIVRDSSLSSVMAVCRKIFATDMLVSKVRSPQEELISLVENRNLGKLQIRSIPIRSGTSKHSPRWDVAMAEVQKRHGSKFELISQGRGFGLEQAINNAAAFAVLALSPSTYDAEDSLPLTWEIE